MATAVTPAVDTTSGVDIKTYNETYRVYAKQGADGKIDQKDISLTTSGKDNAAWNKLEQEGYTNMLEQTVKIYEPGTVSGAQQLISDQDELVAIIVRGFKQKLGQQLKATFTEVSDDGVSFVFDPQVEPLDTLDLLNRETRRRNQSPLDKALKGIKDIVKLMNPGLEGDALDQKVAEMFAAAKGV